MSTYLDQENHLDEQNQRENKEEMPNAGVYQ